MTWQYGGCEWTGKQDEDGIFTDVRLVKVVDLKELESRLIEDAQQAGYEDDALQAEAQADEAVDWKLKERLL